MEQKQKFIPRRVTVTASRETMEALGKCAEDEGRNPREQARVLIDEGLQGRGYLDESGAWLGSCPSASDATA